MIISPARFEDMVNECLTSNTDDKAKAEVLGEILTRTLDSMGYGAGVDRIREYLKR